MKLFLLLLFCHVSSPERHSLEFYMSGFSGISNFPEFIGSALIDGIKLGYCDSEREDLEMQNWTKNYFDKNPEELQHFIGECKHIQPNFFKSSNNYLMQLFNQHEGVHISQIISGCQWDETTGDIFGLLRYGYDGEDLVSFDFKTSTWVAMRPEALVIKLKFDSEKDSKQRRINFNTLLCPGWLKNHLSYGKNILQRKDIPSVSLLQKSSSSPVSCFATGFYPNKAVLFWRKDGDDLHDNVEEGQILPNPDGTFQKSSDLDLSSVRPEDWGKYECVFQLDGLKDDIITKLDQSGIRTNSVPVPPSEFPVGPVVGGVVGLLLLTACICGLLIWRRRVHGYQRGLEVDTELE